MAKHEVGKLLSDMDFIPRGRRTIKMERRKIMAIAFALLAAVLYAINMPFSKILLSVVPETIMAGFLYLGAGIGIGCMFLVSTRKLERKDLLTKDDLPYTIGMIVLDITAPISLMYGLSHTGSASASLLNNFEIVATSIIALMIFKEVISKQLWIALFFVTLASVILTCDDLSGIDFSWGSIFVLLAAVLWGFENNCTRKISGKNVYEIVTIKGIFSGIGSLIIGLVIGETMPAMRYIVLVLILGYVAYGLSIFFYIKAQKDLGAAKTSAYYAVAPFVGALLSFVILHERISVQFFIALVFMALGSIIATIDTLLIK
ncbi:MAG: DMT family transporter [Lachnospiraceae bacterium]|nr:DMT family transporter [Lachnospiraceae bacterium]